MKKIRLVSFFASIAIVLPVLGYASALDQFKTFSANTKSAKGDFTQQQIKMVDGVAKISKTATGTFIFSRPGKFIWSYLKPYEQSLQTDGEKLYIYDKDLNQVTTRDLGGALGASPAAILFGGDDLEKNFNVKEVGIKQGVEWLDATPKAKDTQFEHIGIGMKEGVPMALELRDSFGQVSLVTLKNIEKNPALKADQFKFVVPSGADIFRQ